MKKRNSIIILILLVGAITFIFYYQSHLAKLKNNSAPMANFISRDEFNALDYVKQSEYIKSISISDPKSAWEYLKSNFIIDGQVVGNVHEFAHLIGNVAFEKYGFDGVKICDPSFAFGCFHGVTEKMLLTNGLSGIMQIEEGCLSAFPRELTQDYQGCIHGIGHGVYSFDKENLEQSLKDCDAVSEPNSQFCYDGVFMENAQSLQERSQGESNIQTFDKKNPWKFCTDLDVRYHLNCARYRSQTFLQNSFLDNVSPYKEAGKYCAAGPSILLRTTCFESLGYYIAEGTLGQPDTILQNCNEIESQQGKEICIIGGATESVFQRYAGYNDTITTLCGTLSEVKKVECETQTRSHINKTFED
ncbi:MAG: hypothetical protein ABIS26_02605 [Candidatus Paceibacterota bacterium]